MSKDLEIHLYLLRNLAGDGFDNMVYHLDTGTRLKKTGAMQKLQTLDIDSRNRKVNISHNLEIYIPQFKRSALLTVTVSLCTASNVCLSQQSG